jgi:hypothetical protein
MEEIEAKTGVWKGLLVSLLSCQFACSDFSGSLSKTGLFIKVGYI